MEKLATWSSSGVEGVEVVEEGVLEDGAEFEEVQVALAELVDGVEASAGDFMLSGSLSLFWWFLA